MALLWLLLAGAPLRAQALDALLSPEFSLATQVAPATEVLPALVPHPGQPESLTALSANALRVDLQVDDLLRLRTQSQTATLRLNRAGLTYLRPGQVAYALELLGTRGDEARNTTNSVLDATHTGRYGRLSAATRTPDGAFYAIQVSQATGDVDGDTTALKSYFTGSPIHPFAIDVVDRQALVTLGRRDATGGTSVRLGWRDAAAPLTLYGTVRRAALGFQARGLAWEVRRWQDLGVAEAGVLVAGQSLVGNGDVRWNGADQGDTHSGYHALSLGVAARWQRTPTTRMTAQLTHLTASIDADAFMRFPVDSDIADFLNGTGISSGWIDARATSLHLGTETTRGDVTWRAGYQLALFDLIAGYRYRSQYLGGGVRNPSAEEVRISNAKLHLLGAGVEKRFSWGSIGYGLALTIPQDLSLEKTDLLAQAAARGYYDPPAAGSSSVSGGLVHTLRVEWRF